MVNQELPIAVLFIAQVPSLLTPAPADAFGLRAVVFVDELWTQMCMNFVHIAMGSGASTIAPKNSVLHLEQVSSGSFL